MRLNIPKLAEGGAPLPLVDYMPFTGVGGAGQTASEVEVEDKSKSGSSSSKNDIEVKDIINLTSQLNALPNESRDIARALTELETLIISGHEITPEQEQIRRRRMVNLYSSILSKVKVANFNKQMYDKTYDHLLSNGGLNEVAITQDGKLFVQNIETGKSAKMSVQEFNKLRKDNPGQYEALTNDNLLNERSESAGFSYRNEIMGTINNGIGDEMVTKRLLQVLNGLGKDNLQKEGYSEKSADNIQRGMGVLQQAYEEGMTIDGLYKQGYISEVQKAQTNSALNYLWKNLDPNIKTFLMYKSGEEDAEAGGKKLMADLAFSRNSSKEAFNLDLVKKPGESSSDGSGKGGTDLDPVKALILGMGYQKEFILNTGSSYQARLLGNYSVLTDHSGKPLGEYSTLRDVSSGAFAPSLDFSNATIGGARIDTLDRAFLSNADIIGVDLPIDQKYYAETGIIRPDILLMERVEELHTAIKQGIIDKNDPEKVNAYCDKIGLPHMYSAIDENGIPQLDTNNFARFARINGMVDENALADGQEVDKTVGVVGDNKRDNFKTYMKKENKDYSLDDGFGIFGGRDELYEGAIYIPIRQDLIAASLGGTKYFKVGTQDAVTVAQKWADNQAIQNYQKAPSLAEIKS